MFEHQERQTMILITVLRSPIVHSLNIERLLSLVMELCFQMLLFVLIVCRGSMLLVVVGCGHFTIILQLLTHGGRRNKQIGDITGYTMWPSYSSMFMPNVTNCKLDVSVYYCIPCIVLNYCADHMTARMSFAPFLLWICVLIVHN